MRKLITIAAMLAVGWFSLLSAAYAIQPFPDGECGLNADNSALTVTASNGSDKTYACAASCRYKATGQRPIQTFNCNFSLRANAAEKTVCTLDGDGPKFFSELLPTRMQCEPR